MRKVVIFGAGKLGYDAMQYYINKYDVAYFVDNDSNKWGKTINGLLIKPPYSLLEDSNYTLVVPYNQYTPAICEQLKVIGVIEAVIIFRVSEEMYFLEERKDDEDAAIVSFKGGIGNQLFQFAFFLFIGESAKKAEADLSYYYWPDSRPFLIEKVFPKVSVRRCGNNKRKTYMENKELYFEEPDVRDNWGKYPTKKIERMKCGYFDGYFQTYLYPQNVEKKLREYLVFTTPNDSKYSKFINYISKENAVSVHVRRGDYIQKEIRDIYDDICNEQYYQKAINYILEREENPLLIFLSDDIDWVKEHYFFKSALYINKDMFDKYEDWYDLSIMSKCKHNIIANSSFSWWGAWLNNNENKTVIAPLKWVNYNSQLDICPPEWVRL